MILQELNDDDLNSNLLNMVQSERKLTSRILDFLKEAEARRLFAKRGYSSLFSYCTDYLGYSESAAQRRISSMRLLKEVPEIRNQITSGELTLSNVSKAARFFRQEQKCRQKTYSSAEKNQVLQSIAGKTQKEAEKQLIEISPYAFVNIDKERAVTPEITELRVTLDHETMSQLNRLKELKPGMSTQELLDWMLARTLKQIDPMVKPQRKIKPKPVDPGKSPKSVDSGKSPKSAQHEKSDGKSLPLRTCAKPMRRPLRKEVKHEVWQSAGGCCQYGNHENGRSCKSRFGLEVDHIRPLSLGGDDSVENLRLLCREHHRLFTAESFGF